MEEIEVKFLDIDIDRIQAKLSKIGAKKKFDRLYKRKVYDYPDLRLNAKSAWIRLRDEGDKITLGYKQRKGVQSSDGSSNDTGMKEIELVVNDFDKPAQFLETIGFERKFYEENRRIRWVMDKIEFDIDFWPKLKPYLEIEAPSWELIDEAIKLLGLNPEDKKIFSTLQVYRLAGIDELEYEQITFKRMVKKQQH